MKLIELYNPTEKDITDYPIDEYELDSEGKLIPTGEGNFKKTGQTLTWTLKAGEKAKFPFYVAEYLKKIYEFLVIKREIEAESETPEAGESREPICRKCGKSFKSPKGLALHIAHNHPELL